ncbi:MAG: glycosyltransferase family 87 protein [Elusimicrobiota bacterium]|jgi:hypothetical protein
MSSETRWLLGAWAFVGLLLAFLLLRNGGYGWDSRCYRQFTLEFFATGANPYIRDGWPLSYPPLVLYLFRPWIYLSANVANWLWTVLKLGGFFYIFRIWHRHFLPLSIRDPFQVLFIALAFNGSLFYDVASGNIAGFQQVVLWAGLAALLRKRIWVYCAAVVLMAEIKSDLILLLGLLLFIDDKPRWKELFLSAAAFVILYSLNYLIYPDLFRDYMRLLATLGKRSVGVNNPSTLTFSGQLVDAVRTWPIPWSLPARAGDALYAVLVLGVSGLSWRAYQRIRKRNADPDLRWRILFFIVVFGLVDPRVPPYLYAIFLLPSLWILQKYRWQALIPLAGVMAMFPQGTSSFPRPVNQIFELFNTYLPLMALYAVWILYLKSSYPASNPSLNDKTR